MRRRNIKSTFVLAILLLFSLLLCSCRAGDVSGVISEGATDFSDGKVEKDIPFLTAEEVLAKMMDEFAGSREEPAIETISDDDAKKKKADIKKDDKTTDIKVYEIGSYDDLKQAILDSFDATSSCFDYRLTGSYSFTNTDIQTFFEESTDLDAYDSICLESVQWTNGSDICHFFLNYYLPVSQLRQMKEETRTLVRQAVSEIKVDGKSDYEIVNAVNDYLCDKVEYAPSEPYAPEEHTGYNALKNGSAVCDGYSRAAKMILNELGISCHIEVGDCHEGGGHAWNLVEVDGEWYQLDVTWNDGGQAFNKKGRKEYFLVTDAFMEKSRTWNKSLWPASATKPYK